MPPEVGRLLGSALDENLVTRGWRDRALTGPRGSPAAISAALDPKGIRGRLADSGLCSLSKDIVAAILHASPRSTLPALARTCFALALAVREGFMSNKPLLAKGKRECWSFYPAAAGRLDLLRWGFRFETDKDDLQLFVEGAILAACDSKHPVPVAKCFLQEMAPELIKVSCRDEIWRAVQVSAPADLDFFIGALGLDALWMTTTAASRTILELLDRRGMVHPKHALNTMLRIIGTRGLAADYKFANIVEDLRWCVARGWRAVHLLNVEASAERLSGECGDEGLNLIEFLCELGVLDRAQTAHYFMHKRRPWLRHWARSVVEEAAGGQAA